PPENRGRVPLRVWGSLPHLPRTSHRQAASIWLPSRSASRPRCSPAAGATAAWVLRLSGGRRVRLYCRLDPAAVALTRIGSAGEDDAAPALAAADLAFAEGTVHERRPVCAPEAALAAVPVEARGETVGALLLVGEAARGFTEHEMM